MSDKRVVKDGNRYYPEYYNKPYFFGLLGGYWKRYESDELWLNGIFTTLEKCDLSYSNLQMAKDFLKENKSEVIYEK